MDHPLATATIHSPCALSSVSSPPRKPVASILINLKPGSLSLRVLTTVTFVFHAFIVRFLVLFQSRPVTISSSSEPESEEPRRSELTADHCADSGKQPLHLGVNPVQSIFLGECDVESRRELAFKVQLTHNDEYSTSSWQTHLFVNSRRQTLFTQSWTPSSKKDMKALVVLLHGLNEHSGRYFHFARQLNSQGYGVFAMDWIGHGGSDGLHGYVTSLDHVVTDVKSFLHRVVADNPGIRCFLLGHSTGGAIALKTALHPSVEEMLEGVILTSPALRVRPAHPAFKVLAPVFSLLLPKLQFKGANKRGIPVSRDPAALVAKYTDPLVYTRPIRIRTGSEILRITADLQRNLNRITVPFFVLHGTADKVTDPVASEELYHCAASKYKNIKLYDGFLHDLLFEPEREEITDDIIKWMDDRCNT